MSRPSIWYMLPVMDLGGTEKHVIRLAAGLSRRGYDAGIVSVFQEGALADEIRSHRIPFVCLNVPEGWSAGTLLAVFRWLKLQKIDILHTYLFGFHLFAGFAARILKIPVILSSRREIAHWQRGRHFLTEKLGNLFVDRVVCCSRAVERWTLDREKLSPEKVLTIYNGIDLQQFQPHASGARVRKELGIPESAPVVGTVANFAFEKGYPYLLEAASLVLQARPEAWFLLVGRSSSVEEEIKEKARQIEGNERILFTGFREDIPELLEAMDIFVLASVIEGFPNVLLEALAMARTVVATEVGGVPELIQSGENGVLVPSRNGRAIAEAVLALLADPEKMNQMALRGQEKVKRHFDLGRMVGDYERLYLSLLKRGGAKKISSPELLCVES